MHNLHNSNPYENHPYYKNYTMPEKQHTPAAAVIRTPVPEHHTTKTMLPDYMRRMNIINTFRRLWFEHVMWTRSVITSTASDNPDLNDTIARLLRNPADFAEVLLPLYGKENSDRFKQLLTDHLAVANDLLLAHKAHDLNRALPLRDKWYHNADEIAAALFAMNPFWNKDEFQKMMHTHLALTEDEMLLRLDGDYKADIKQFDLVQQEALKMADMMSEGLIKQLNI